jgi:FHS family L-fucose permease-like MFS transporter
MTSISTEKNNTLKPIAIIAGLFFVFGFVTWINGALIPFMKTINELTDAQSYLVASASYISFVVMALPASYIIGKIGYRKGMSLGLIVMAIGALVFIPAASARTYWIFLTGIFIQGLGMTLLQTASNPYITILGPIESAAKRIAIMGIANKVAGALGSLIFGAILLSGIDGIKEKLEIVSATEKAQLLDTMADSVVTPYIIMAVVLFILGLLIRKAPLPHVEAEPIEDTGDGTSTKTSIFHFPHLWLGVLALFVYVGAEVIAGDTIISYGISLDIMPWVYS